MLDVGSLLAGRYRLIKLVGRGGMADVWLAHDTRRHVDVAIKVLREDLAEDIVFLQRFRKEADALRRLDHPHIVRFYEFETEGALAFLVTDFIDGETLSRRIRLRNGPLDMEEILSILDAVARALSYAHNTGIVHRDVKPGNIMIDQQNRIYLADFGIARIRESGTVTQNTPLTPGFAAPEQWLGKPVDERTDVYALAITLYAMLTGGMRPFIGDNEDIPGTQYDKLMHEHLHVSPKRPSHYNLDLSPAVDAVILRALAKDPAERTTDVLTLVREFESAIQNVDIPEPPENEAPWWQRVPPFLAAVGVVLVVMGTAAVLGLFSGNDGLRPITPDPGVQTQTASALVAKIPEWTPTFTRSVSPTSTVLQVTATAPSPTATPRPPTATSTRTRTPTSTPTSTQTRTRTPRPTRTALPPTATPRPTDTRATNQTPKPTNTALPAAPTPIPSTRIVTAVSIFTPENHGGPGNIWVEMANAIEVVGSDGRKYRCGLGFVESRQPQIDACWQRAGLRGAPFGVTIRVRAQHAWSACHGVVCNEFRGTRDRHDLVLNEVWWTTEVWTSLLNDHLAGGWVATTRNRYYDQIQRAVFTGLCADPGVPSIGFLFERLD